MIKKAYVQRSHLSCYPLYDLNTDNLELNRPRSREIIPTLANNEIIKKKQENLEDGIKSYVHDTK